MTLRERIHNLRSLWGPYVRRMTEPRWMAKLKQAETAWRNQFVRIEKEREQEQQEIAAILRAVTDIKYSRRDPGGGVCIQIMVPAMELASYAPYHDNEFFRHTARYVGHMLEREFAQLNMTTLAQHIRASEKRQYELERQRYTSPFFGLGG